MSIRQQLYKKYRLEGYSKYTAARKAGYSHNYASKQAKKLDEVVNMDYWLEKEGLTDAALAQHAREGLHANKVQSCDVYVQDKDGQLVANANSNDFIEVPDWHVRHKYYRTVLELMNRITKQPLIEQHTHYVYKWLTQPQSDNNPVLPATLPSRDTLSPVKK